MVPPRRGRATRGDWLNDVISQVLRTFTETTVFAAISISSLVLGLGPLRAVRSLVSSLEALDSHILTSPSALDGRWPGMSGPHQRLRQLHRHQLK